jgi:hypothetical protein
MNEFFVNSANLSQAWVQAVDLASRTRKKEATPLVVSITGFSSAGDFQEDPYVRAQLDKYLLEAGKQTVQSVANTLFPTSLWNRNVPRGHLFERYIRMLPKLRASSTKNKRGLYFERMITGGPNGRDNQLEFALSEFTRRKGVRRSILQVGVFQPSVDHSASALIGFPCLQHVTFAPTEQGLSVNAFYAAQYLVERAYGNYVGLCRLGQFVAHELRIPLARFTCFTGIAELERSRAGIEHILTGNPA